MTTQPEALRLAQELDAYHTRSCHKEAAAELRRLRASCEDYAQHKQRQDQRVLELAERVLELKDQRDALLEALKDMLNAENDYPYGGMSESEISAIRKARAAIASVEETK